MQHAVQGTVVHILDAVTDTLEQTPPELSSDIAERGITLAGGGALLRGFPHQLSAQTALPVHVVDEPLTCVAVGAGRCLDEFDAIARSRPQRRTTKWPDRVAVARRCPIRHSMSSSAVLAIPRLPEHNLRAKFRNVADRPLDLAVVGAGVIGLAIARELSRRGASVAVFERTGVGAGASGVQPGGVRQQWGTTESLPSRAGVGRVLRPGRRAARIARAARLPALRLPVPRALRGDARTANGERRRAERRGHPVADRLTGRGGASSCPGWRSRRSSAAPGAPRTATSTARKGSSRRLPAGSTCASGTCGPSTNSRRTAVVVAAGADTPALLPRVADRARGAVSLLSEPIRERLLEPLVVSAERRFAAKQLVDGRVLASDLGAVGDDAQRRAWRANVRAQIESPAAACSSTSTSRCSCAASTT